MRTQSGVWEEFWKKYSFDTTLDRRIVSQELLSLRFRKIKKKLTQKFPGIEGLSVIEIGSGRGEVSAALALNGAKVTLIDNSGSALDKAKVFFSNIGAQADFIKADIFKIPPRLLNSFDISMSFGLAEHFNYPQRLEVIKIHKELLKPEGISLIGVPNKYCFPYRFFMVLAKLLGYALKEIEIPYSPAELKSIAAQAGFSSYNVAGSSFLRDSVYFLCTRYISHLSHWKLILDTSPFEIPLVFDDFLGYSLVLMGEN
jgi:2-polyprenyl-3-methyl-5-hydroxy-6-metoxy-1,4-benzoquinol methylase